jgi:hypothetical protein
MAINKKTKTIKKTTKKKDADNGVCKKNASFKDCELAILRSAVDLASTQMGKKMVNTPEVQDMLSTVEDFLKKKNLICYGGIAINALLPENEKIYNKDVELSDYDFFSANALEDAKELADIYYKKGYKEIDARSGAHHGTYKVFVNFIGVADITSIPSKLFDVLKKEAVRVNGILYCPPNYLRMAMYLELSRPAGDVSRWEKVMKRLSLINDHYPLNPKQCSTIDFQREMTNHTKEGEIYETVKDVFIHQGCVFFGGYAISMYAEYMPTNLRTKLKKIPDFDVLSEDPQGTIAILKERLKDIGEKNVNIIKHEPLGEIIPDHYEVKVKNDTVAFIYKPIACHSYNEVSNKQHQRIRIATIDTMLSFYLAFLYADKPYYDPDRIICMSKYLFDVQQKNRLEQKGLLKRFSITCYGHQHTLEEMRAEKTAKFKELSTNRGSKEFEEWFLSYRPDQNSGSNLKNTFKQTTRRKNTFRAKTFKQKTKTGKLI